MKSTRRGSGEGFFNKNFDGFKIGTGSACGHNHQPPISTKRKSISAYWTIEGGYVWKFYKTLYIEPCLALNVMLSKNKISLYGFSTNSCRYSAK